MACLGKGLDGVMGGFAIFGNTENCSLIKNMEIWDYLFFRHGS
jgi:hypothetical protein